VLVLRREWLVLGCCLGVRALFVDSLYSLVRCGCMGAWMCGCVGLRCARMCGWACACVCVCVSACVCMCVLRDETEREETWRDKNQRGALCTWTRESYICVCVRHCPPRLHGGVNSAFHVGLGLGRAMCGQVSPWKRCRSFRPAANPKSMRKVFLGGGSQFGAQTHAEMQSDMQIRLD